MKAFHFIIFFLFANSAASQVPFQMDTLTYHNRIGSNLDSIDVSSSDFASTFDGGRCITCPVGLSPSSLFSDFSRPVFQPRLSQSKLLFSALPHIGFAYTFGGQGTQVVKANYQQIFGSKTILNLNYNRSVGNGFLRSSAYNQNDVSLRLARKSRLYSFNLVGNYQNNLIQHPGGITTDTLIEAFGLEFTPVFKASAESRNTYGLLQLTNYLNFKKDSINQFGLLSFHEYAIRNRVFIESDTLFGIYPSVFIDSFVTRDQYNLPTVTNGAGFYLFSNNGKMYADLKATHAYWDYQNLGKHQYQSEYGVKSNVGYGGKKLKIGNQAYYNLAGRFNEWSETIQLSYSDSTWMVGLHGEIADVAIEPWQRRYSANQYNYDLDFVSNQFHFTAGINSKFVIVDSLLTAGVFGDFYHLKDPYLLSSFGFEKGLKSNFNFGRVGANLAFAKKFFHIHLNGIYSFDTDGYLPDFQLYLRPFIEGGLFKAKKLKGVFGVDFSYTTPFQLRNYVPNIDYYEWTLPTGISQSMTNLSAFVSLGIDEFRFYVRYENIGYFWNDQKLEVSERYPISGTRLRVGITWDFFN